LQKQLKKYAADPFAASDAIMSRCISTAISLTWTEEQIKEKGEKIVEVIKKVLAKKLAAV
jgi:8-amino-3,8-dideoxy-alpha-D-manno-octulosonate transaminase